MNKIDKKIKTKIKESKDYMIFLEIRGCSFSYLDNQLNNNEIFECFSDRKFAEFNNKKFGNQMHFTAKHLISMKKNVKSKKNEIEELKINKNTILNNSARDSLEKNEEKDKNIYQFIAKNKISIKKKHNLQKSKFKKEDSLFLTNSVINSDIKILKMSNSQTLLQNNNKYVDASSKNVEIFTSKHFDTNLKLNSKKFIINDNKLNNFCKDLLKNQNAKKDEIKGSKNSGSKNSGFISANKTLANKLNEEKQSIKINSFTQKDSSKIKISRKNSTSSPNHQEIEEVRKYYKYLSVLNKIRNLSIIGSTRIDTPSNKRVRLYEEIQNPQNMIKKNDLNNTTNEGKPDNIDKSKSLFRHNKPLITNLTNLHKFHRTKSSVNMVENENKIFPIISNVNITSNFNFNSGNGLNDCNL